MLLGKSFAVLALLPFKVLKVGTAAMAAAMPGYGHNEDSEEMREEPHVSS